MLNQPVKLMHRSILDEFIHCPKPYLLLLATCDEILPWMIELWMRIDLVRDIDYNTINLRSSRTLQRMTNSVGDTIPQFTISIEKDN